jgi:hypothetical protein
VKWEIIIGVTLECATSLIKQIKMKKVLLLLSVLFMTLSYAQEIKQVSQISCYGDKVIPDQATYPPRYKQKGIMLRIKKKEMNQYIEAVLK